MIAQGCGPDEVYALVVVGLVVILLPLLVLAFAVRVAAVPLIGPRNPKAAAAVVRYWTWLPLAFLWILLVVVAWPLALVMLAIGVVLLVQKRRSITQR